MKTILVTGGAGFIGSHLCKKLVAAGNKVICADNLFTGSKNNIIDLLPNPNFEFILYDITSPLELEVEQIFNLACPASPVYYQRDPIKTIKTSILGALNMLELARKNHARILQASTSEVYGNPDIHPQTEVYHGNVNIIGPRSCYDEGKRAAETLFFDYNRQYQVDIRVLRIFNTYGPYMQCNDGRVISNFVLQALQNQNITIYGDGKQTRSFCFVDDLVKGMIEVMNCEDSEMTGPFNIGNPQEISMLSLSETIISLAGSSSGIIHKPLPVDDPVRRKPDIRLIGEKIGWKPEISLEEGLSRTIAYFKALSDF